MAIISRRSRLCYSVASVCLSSAVVVYDINVLWLSGVSYGPRAIVTIGSQVVLLEIDWYQNEWPWHLFRGRSKSCKPLCHVRHWISWKLLDIEAWFQRTAN